MSGPDIPAHTRLWAAVLVALAAACTPIAEAPEAPAPSPAPEVPEGPAIDEGLHTPEDVEGLADALARGEEALAAGDAGRAVEEALEAEARYARVPGSSRAVWLRARALRAAGDQAASVLAVEEYLGLLEDEPGEVPPEALGEALFLLADLRLDEGATLEGTRILFQIPADVPTDLRDQALERARSAADRLSRSELEELRDAEADVPALLAPYWTELALRLHLAGDVRGAEALAERIGVLEPAPEEVESVRAIREGRVEELLGPAPVLGALLPSSGSPSLQQLAQGIQDGIEVALAQARREGVSVQLEVRDDGGDPGRAAQLLQELSGTGAPVVLGPLTDQGLRSAGQAGGEALLFSPTARLLPDGVSGIFSLAAVDREGPGSLARFALDRGVRSAVVFHRRDDESEAEARYFTQAFQDGGGTVVRTVSYAPGTTSFQAPMQQIRAAGGQALALFLPADQIELVAPQVTYFEIDELELQLLGGESWTEESVLQNVDPRHTDGLVSVVSRPERVEDEAWQSFVEAYEDHFQRTLRSSVPALGYDAARLVLAAYARGAGTPQEVMAVLEGIGEFRGATGRMTIEKGRLVREHRLVRIENRRLVPVGTADGMD